MKDLYKVRIIPVKLSWHKSHLFIRRWVFLQEKNSKALSLQVQHKNFTIWLKIFIINPWYSTWSGIRSLGQQLSREAQTPNRVWHTGVPENSPVGCSISGPVALKPLVFHTKSKQMGIVEYTALLICWFSFFYCLSRKFLHLSECFSSLCSDPSAAGVLSVWRGKHHLLRPV